MLKRPLTTSELAGPLKPFLFHPHTCAATTFDAQVCNCGLRDALIRINDALATALHELEQTK